MARASKQKTGQKTAEAGTVPGWNLGGIVSGLRQARLDWRKRQGKREQGARELPSPAILKQAFRELSGVLFPMRLGPHDLRDESVDYYVGRTLAAVLGVLEEQVLLELLSESGSGKTKGGTRPEIRAREKVRAFAEALPSIRRVLDTDVEAAHQGDPAARSVDEVLLCYPGIAAITHHRLAHKLFGLGLPLIARILSEVAHSETGIDIHPGAVIGPGFFIDHGTGVVIGETAVIGSRVRLYQAVTLGAKSFPKADDGSLRKGLRRHPVVGDDVVIYAGATVLGRVALGKGAVIGGNVWLTRSVPEGGTVTQGLLQKGGSKAVHAAGSQS